MNKIINGDCLEVMKTFEDNSIDSIITDPPYSLNFMNSKWDRELPSIEVFQEMLRILKPGGNLFCFGGSMTFHRLACNIEDAGWVLRDVLLWLYSSGFPKSHNIALNIDKQQGHENRGHAIASGNKYHPTTGKARQPGEYLDSYEPKTEDGKKWEGYGTALKPAYEPIIWAQKPSEKNYANNALEYGVAGINIDGCRIETDDFYSYKKCGGSSFGIGRGVDGTRNYGKDMHSKGRWPANVCHDGSEEVMAEFDKYGERGYGKKGSYSYQGNEYQVKGFIQNNSPKSPSNYGDIGGISRFFYCSKATKQERNAGLEDLPLKESGGLLGTKDKSLGTGSGNERNNLNENYHSTVKPLKLMKWLCSLTKMPEGSLILDPFCGSGTTCIAASLTGNKYIGIEQDAGYCEIAEKRIKYWASKEVDYEQKVDKKGQITLF